MKKQIILAIAKLTLSALLITTVATVNAQTNVAAPVEKSAVVKYLGADDGMVSFNVTYDNPGGNKFSVIILDKSGNTLFQEFYYVKKFEKKFKLPTQEISKLTFVIRNAKDGDITQSFEVNAHVVEDVVVTKL